MQKEKTAGATKERIKRFPIDEIINGDAIEILKKIPTETIDLIIVDPPYWKVINEKWDYQWRTDAEYIEWSKQWFMEAAQSICWERQCNHSALHGGYDGKYGHRVAACGLGH